MKLQTPKFKVQIGALLSFGFWCLVFAPAPALAVTDTINVYLTVTNSGGSITCPAGQHLENGVCVPDGGGGGGGTPLKIQNIVSIPDKTTSLITWETNLSAYSTISWGKTLFYELGSIVESAPDTSHEALITALDPDTTYYFKIEVVDAGNTNNTASVTNQSFHTLSEANSPPANPLNFEAHWQATLEAIKLTWQNPADPDFSVVRIVRGDSFFPEDPSEGIIIYEGSLESALDYDVEPGKTYYYTIFARDTAGQYSSGAVASETVPKEGEIPTEEEPPVNIFEELPPSSIATSSEFMNLNFIFSQSNKAQLFKDGSKISLGGTENSTISIGYSSLPEVLKTIAVTLHHPKDRNKIFAFLLRVNDSKTDYAATIAPLLDPGEYPVDIYVLDHKHAKLARIQGAVTIAPQTITLPLAVARLPKNLLPIGSAIGIAAGLTQIIIATTQVGSLYDLYLLAIRLFGALLVLLGLRKKHKQWGTVYDSVTKRPLDPAYVVVHDFNAKELGQKDSSVGEAITDLDGRYGFLLPGGQYVIEANKTHYLFPSKLLASKERDELYDNLYHGEALHTQEGEVVTRNIPLDPINFDWNEFAKSKSALFRVYSRNDKIKSAIFSALYTIGFIFTLLSTFVTPNTFNLVVLSTYIALFLIERFWSVKSKASVIKDAVTGEPYSFAVVRVYMSHLNQEIKSLVADQFGRFYLLVAPGKYYITVDAKQPDASYKRVYRSGVVDLPKGVLSGDILISNSQFSISKQAPMPQFSKS
ncbi:MAG TPA: hypothetical protein VJG48_03495 [Candidatus Paceibacterota bacterium]